MNLKCNPEAMWGKKKKISRVPDRRQSLNTDSKTNVLFLGLSHKLYIS